MGRDDAVWSVGWGRDVSGDSGLLGFCHRADCRVQDFGAGDHDQARKARGAVKHS
jgi:hypothetical protein